MAYVLFGDLALFLARLAILLVWSCSDHVSTAYQTVLWPGLGFLFLPLTTLAYAWAWHSGHGSVAGIRLLVIVLAAAIDLTLLATSELRWFWRPRRD
jgi:hypothetical protein